VVIDTQSRHHMQLSLAAELLRSFGGLRMTALGVSMVPSLFPGDILTIRRENTQNIRRGDMVLYWRDERFYVHRVVGKIGTSADVEWITRGDALTENDPSLTERELLGRVTLIQRDAAEWHPTLPSGLACFVQWGVRRSNTFLRIVLAGYLFYRRFARRIFAAGVLRPSGIG